MRRHKKFAVSEQLFLSIFRKGLRRYEVAKGIIPEDAIIVSVRFDAGTPQKLWVTIASPEFPDLAEGEDVPEFFIHFRMRP